MRLCSLVQVGGVVGGMVQAGTGVLVHEFVTGGYETRVMRALLIRRMLLLDGLWLAVYSAWGAFQDTGVR